MKPGELAALAPFWAAEADIVPNEQMARLSQATRALDHVVEMYGRPVELDEYQYFADALALGEAGQEAYYGGKLLPPHDSFTQDGVVYHSQFLVIDARNPFTEPDPSAQMPDQCMRAYFLLVRREDASQPADLLLPDPATCAFPYYIIVPQDTRRYIGASRKELVSGNALVFEAYADGNRPLATSAPTQVQPRRVHDLEYYMSLANEVEHAVLTLLGRRQA